MDWQTFKGQTLSSSFLAFKKNNNQSRQQEFSSDISEMAKILYSAYLGLLLVILCVCGSQQQLFHMIHAEEQQSVSMIQLDTSSSAVDSGSQFIGTVTAYDFSGKVSTLSGYVVTLSVEGSGVTVRGPSFVTLQNGVASFSMSISTSSTLYVTMKAELKIGLSSYSYSKNLLVNNYPRSNASSLKVSLLGFVVILASFLLFIL